MEQQYTILAKYYDKFMGDFDYDGYVAFVKDYLHGEGVDLCCGSGKITIRLFQSGAKVIGVDACVQMLNEARSNAKKVGLNIQWLCMDASQFQPQKKLDFACAVCDGFNYLSPSTLKKTLDNAATFIKKDGYLVFDISTYYKLKNIVGDNVFCDDEDDVSYIWSNHFDTKRNAVDMQIGFFERQQGNNYVRVDERHLQYAHTTQSVEAMLCEAWSVSVVDGETYGQLTPTSKRALFVCKRR
ncbi:MAG: class I SAM-dependent methyltransferase [Clostridia bacterium]